MALKKADIIISHYGVTQVVPVGESWLIKNVILRNASAAANTRVMFIINEATPFWWEDYYTYGSFMQTLKGMITGGSLMSYLFGKGLFRGVPVGEGQRVSISPINALNNQAYSVIDVFDAGDKKPTDPNGSDSAEVDFLVSYIISGTTFASGDNWLKQLMSGLTIFEVEGNDLRAPVNKEITLYGFMTRDVRKVSGTDANEQNSTYLKFVKNREVLYANDVNGIPMKGDITKVADGTYIGAGTCIAGMHDSAEGFEPYLFQVPLVLGEGEKIGVSLVTEITKGVANILQADYILYLIGKSRTLR